MTTITTVQTTSVTIAEGDTLTVTSTGEIGVATGNAVHSNYNTTVDNAGRITTGSATSSGVNLAAGGTINNEGYIAGRYGARIDGKAVVNNGTGGATTAEIHGNRYGVYTKSGTSQITNAGLITASTYGVYIKDSTAASVVNTGSITTSRYGVYFKRAIATIENHGTITGNYAGVQEFSHTADTPGNTVINAGTIGGGGYAVKLLAGDDTVAMTADAVFNGIVDAGTGTDTLSLMAGTSGSWAGFGTQYTGFEVVRLETGADWTIGAVASGTTVRFAGASGALRLLDPANTTALIDGFQTGNLIQLKGGGTATSVTWHTGGTVTFDGGATSVTLNFGDGFTQYDANRISLDTDLLGGTKVTLNESLSIHSNDGADSITLGVNENTTAVLTPTAQDIAGTTLVWSLSGDDAASFTIDPQTGVIAFAVAPDYEAPADADGNGIYDITLTVSNGSVSDSQQIAVRVDNVNEPPVFIGSTTAFMVAENTPAVSTIAATDPEGGSLAYSIADGPDAALFTIDTFTGALKFLNPPDFENPADADHDNIYTLTILAEDIGGGTTRSLTVTVTDVNEAPVFSGSTALTANENATAADTIAASDHEGTAVGYAITGGSDAALFTIDAATGVLSFITAPDYESPADADGDNVYDLTVSAGDGVNSTARAYTVTVADVNDAPVFGGSAALAMIENTTAAGTVTATDPEGAAIHYAISGRDAALFAIDSVTGALSFLAAPDYENPADAGTNNVYDLTVSATDGVNSATRAYTVTVGDADETPVFSGTTAFTLAENTTAAGTIAAADPEGAAITYAITGGADAALFAIDSVTGALSFAMAPDFEAPADADGDNVYDLTVTASDGVNAAAQAYTVTVADANEAPVFGGSALTLAENTADAGAVAATDPEGTALLYSIDGADAALFAINSLTGALFFVGAPDYEAPADADGDNVYDLTVTASDGMNIATQAYTVTVTDADEAPAFTSDAAVSIVENGVAAVTLAAVDPEGATIRYGIVGGDDAALFTVDSLTGALAFAVAPDYEAAADADGDNVYQVTVSASDGTLTALQALTVAVTDANDTPEAVDDSFSLVRGETLPGNVISNDLDPDAGGLVVTAVNGAALDPVAGSLSVAGIYGTLTIAADGTLGYVADLAAGKALRAGETGTDVFTYTIADIDGDGDTGSITIVIDGKGSAGGSGGGSGGSGSGDTLFGADDDLYIDGDAGSVLRGLGGADTIEGEGGADTIYGNTGDDMLLGGADGDHLFGGQGSDMLYGNLGADILYGNLSDDTLYGGQGEDTVYGGQGDDALFGNAGDDVFYAGAGDDTVTGGDGADRFVIQAGDHVTVTDYDAAEDVLSLLFDTAIGFVDDGAGNAVFDDGTTYVLLLGVNPADAGLLALG